MELLAPAGSMEALRAAVCNGADAVYLGAGTFNARMNARNFSAADLQEAIVYCHVRGVKVHLTLNTLVLDREMQHAADLIRMAAAFGVDAFIVQDLGVVSLCREIAPDVPVHASTQMSITRSRAFWRRRPSAAAGWSSRGSFRRRRSRISAKKARSRSRFSSMARCACAIPGSVISRPSSAGAPATGASAPSPAACPMATAGLNRPATP